MSDPIKHFLLVFDHDVGRLIDTREFGSDQKLALAAYAAKEQEYRGSNDIEIVLIGSDSFETVRFTHSNYFDGSASISKLLAGL